MRRRSVRNKTFALVVFTLFSLLLLGGIWYQNPGWGLMDDLANIKVAGSFWLDPHHAWAQNVASELNRGRFRPGYFLWIILAYRIAHPLFIYMLMAALNISILLVWGRSIGLLFEKKDPQRDFLHYIYPWTFFLFAPFWNNFMYISLQEKFLFIFGGISLYFFIRSYQKDSLKDLGWAGLFLTFSLFSKETSAAFLVVYILYALFDLIIFKENKKISVCHLAVYTVYLGGYYIFVKHLLKGYTGKYNEAAHSSQIFLHLVNAPGIIRLLLLLGITAVGGYVGIFFFKRTKNPRPEYILFPLFLTVYIILLAPWGYMTYLLAPLAPFVMVLFLPGVYFLNRCGQRAFYGSIGLTVMLSLVAVLYIGMPKIERIANIQKTVTHIKGINTGERESRFFYPWPYIETGVTLPRFTQADVIYLKDGHLTEKMLGEGDNYLVYDIQASATSLRDITIGPLVYQNSTWKIYRLKRSVGKKEEFKPAFDLNAVQKLKNFIKRI